MFQNMTDRIIKPCHATGFLVNVCKCPWTSAYLLRLKTQETAALTSTNIHALYNKTQMFWIPCRGLLSKWQRCFCDLQQHMCTPGFCLCIFISLILSIAHPKKKYFAEIFIFVKCCISNRFPFVDFQVHQETWSLLNCVIVFVTSFFVVNLNLSFISKGHEDSSLASFTIVFDKWSELRWLWFCHR